MCEKGPYNISLQKCRGREKAAQEKWDEPVCLQSFQALESKFFSYSV